MRAVSSLAPGCFLAPLLLAACSGGVPSAPGNAANAAAPANTAEPAENAGEPPAPAENASISVKAGKVEFDYAWPREAAGIPDLDVWLRGNAERLRKQTEEGGKSEQASAQQNGYEFHGYSYSEAWHVEADLPALLVMQSDGYSYTGGAHGMPIVTVLFWDKAAKKRLGTSDLFDLPALIAALKPRFCKALNAERSERRGEPVNPKDDNQLPEFVQCVDPANQTVLPVSKSGKTLDTIRFVIMPYEAGPYAEGIYEIDLPVTAAVLKAVKPAYKASFGAS